MTSNVPKKPGDIHYWLEITPHEWATDGESFETGFTTRAELGRILRREADRWDPPNG